jgi:hypothetical protein
MPPVKVTFSGVPFACDVALSAAVTESDVPVGSETVNEALDVVPAAGDVYVIPTAQLAPEAIV